MVTPPSHPPLRPLRFFLLPSDGRSIFCPSPLPGANKERMTAQIALELRLEKSSQTLNCHFQVIGHVENHIAPLTRWQAGSWLRRKGELGGMRPQFFLILPTTKIQSEIRPIRSVTPGRSKALRTAIRADNSERLLVAATASKLLSI